MKLLNAALLVGVTLLSARALAVPAAPFPIELRNEDGTAVVGRLFGDEHLSWAEDLEGYALAWEPALGAWHYATVAADGRLAPLPYRAGVVSPRLLSLSKHLRPSPRIIDATLAKRAAIQRSPRLVPLQGTVPNLVLLVKFTCTAASGGCNSRNTSGPVKTAAQFTTLFNGATGSVKEFYNEISYGKVQLTSTVATGNWIQLPKNDSYYVYNGNNPYGHPEDMVVDAINVLNQQRFNFKAFDSNGDNIIDAIDVIHVGYGYEYSGDSRDIHSHYMDLRQISGQFQTWDGVWIYGYHTEPEYQANKSDITAIGTICHETAHFFGLPDLYDYTDASSGLGMWSLMAAGSWGGTSPSYPDGTRPVHPDAWSKYKLGYLAPTRVTGSLGGLRLRPTKGNAEAFLVEAGMPYNQYFLLENRYRTGYDGSIPYSGLAIYHVDENQQNNDDSSHYLVDLEQADGLRQLNTSPSEMGDQGDVWPYGSATAFTPTSNPNSKPYNSSTGKISVQGITRSGTDILFDINVAGTATKANGQPCTTGVECSSTFCADGVCCNTACGAGPCDACSRAMGADSDGACKLLTIACNDGSNCTTGDTCQGGVCSGNPVTCPGSSACRWASSCDPSSGSCTAGAAKPDGTACDDGNACTQNDGCQAGTCRGTLVGGGACPAPDSCHEASTCNQATGQCAPYPVKPDGTSCSDNNACTTADSCRAGVCVGGSARTCSGEDACHTASTCDPTTGECIPGAPKANGTACDDKSACTSNDKCQNGVCLGTVSATTCSAPDQCHEAGVCDPSSGRCIAPAKADGTACNDGTACTRVDTCIGGACVGSSPVVCPAQSGCYESLGCDWQTGRCSARAKPNGSSCDDMNPCTENDGCFSGICLGVAKTCEPIDECHGAGQCEVATGECSSPKLDDGTECSDGVCQAGRCKASVAPAAPATGGGCGGCATGGTGPAPMLLGALAVLGLLRRRRAAASA